MVYFPKEAVCGFGSGLTLLLSSSIVHLFCKVVKRILTTHNLGLNLIMSISIWGKLGFFLNWKLNLGTFDETASDWSAWRKEIQKDLSDF